MAVKHCDDFLMGWIAHPPVADLCLKMRDQLGLDTFVETGVWQGRSTVWAAQQFNQVYTIDIRLDCLVAVKEGVCRDFKNVTYLHGDSRQQVPSLLATSPKPMVWWLDAHNAGQQFGDGPDDCPVLEELDAILQTGLPHGILIDDACCFVPPMLWDPEKWPDIALIREMAEHYGYLLSVGHDVIAIAPQSMNEALSQFVG